MRPNLKESEKFVTLTTPNGDSLTFVVDKETGFDDIVAAAQRGDITPTEFKLESGGDEIAIKVEVN